MIRVNGDPCPWHEGMTVGELLELKKFTFPMLIVHIGETHVPKAEYDTTAIPDGAVIRVFHLLSGG